MTLEQYIQNINSAYKRGNATEHTYRGDLKQLIESIVTDVAATNEPKRQQCGAPDYIITKKDIPIGFIEAKDIGDKDLSGAKKTGNKEQFDRYKNSLNNLIFTDYLDFHLYIDGVFITKIAIAEIQDGTIVPSPANFATFTNLIKDFCVHISQSIKSSKKLAEMMAGKARLLSDVIEQALTSDENNSEDSTLKDQMNAFKEILIHDITPKGFADVYAQTIAYGMFAARLHDPTLPTFSRQEAAELIPKSNPFLRKLFGYIAGPDIDDRIKWIVDSLVDIFLACNVEQILKNYGKSTKMEDPIIHFYETFLSEYDPKLRKARGVWYTPKPVVNFIVRAVDDILKTEFDLPQGLADNSKTKIKIDLQGKKVDQEVHRVQILDPATGTGTFLAEVVKHVHKKFKGQQGVWSNYVETHLLPRLNGFELLMASYAMAHLQMDLLLTETGFKPTNDQRLKIYLTNSLEESHPDTGTLFANWLSSEANEANFIKRDTPVMCIVGNPPYASSSTNKGKWIESLTADYKKDLKEKSYNSLSDDYVKFIRYGQHFVDKNGSGILAYISNNSFIDGITHRQMRKNLLESFDKIYILDLHGDAKKKEVCLDGSADNNVFDIMQGVSINIFIKTGSKKKNELGKVLHYDLQGKRDFKYTFLNENSLKSLKWNKLEYSEPNYFFTNKNFKGENEYELGFKIDKLFIKYNNGIETGKDAFFYNSSKDKLASHLAYSFQNKENTVTKFEITNTESFKFLDKFHHSNFFTNKISLVSYRPFDNRFSYYDIKLQRRPAFDIMKNMLESNIGLLVPRQFTGEFKHVYISKNPTDCNLTGTAKKFGSAPLFPLYLYPETNGQQQSLSGFETLTGLNEPTNGQQQSLTGLNEPTGILKRIPNFNAEIISQIAKLLGLTFVAEKELEGNVCMANNPEVRPEFRETFAPIDILDYIYAVLHSPTYREKYKEFLKIDFPKIPFPKDTKTFWDLVELGSQIRETHLLESATVEEFITEFNIDGDCVVSKPRFEISPIGVQNPDRVGMVWINETQYFENVPEVAWNFYIGGYQPAQKWLKDRKERKLEFDDIAHYQKIIVALTETDRLMKAIDTIAIE
ncbi:type ISP restriction/modification enzyme [Flavobacterium urumqiense]|uniref:site-specific DNA-methyltransferase (adenine-specific) n=1 Tax=Flavobacterium urumqiense TaxID=935224 RepID=A0A1H5RUQ7_9FLAO|nr:type ISP restriction/modification enzyme [Flavobacterium urumqiense]SEF42069.1 N-6 DNA Methylase [Flavobacterium urumqiense]